MRKRIRLLKVQKESLSEVAEKADQAIISCPKHLRVK